MKEKSEETSEKDWDKMNRTTCSLIRSCLTQDIKYHVLYETSTMKLWEILEKKYLIKKYRVSTAFKDGALSRHLD